MAPWSRIWFLGRLLRLVVPERRRRLVVESRRRRFPPAFLQDFRVTGVISSGGHSEAVVSYKQLSGSLRRGDRGGRTTDLLPAGWSVAAVDVPNGRLILQSGSRRVKVEL